MNSRLFICRCISEGIFFSVIYNMSAGILNAVGNSKRSLVYLMIAAISNIFLDLLFVVVLKMGIVGAALPRTSVRLILHFYAGIFDENQAVVVRVRLGIFGFMTICLERL